MKLLETILVAVDLGPQSGDVLAVRAWERWRRRSTLGLFSCTCWCRWKLVRPARRIYVLAQAGEAATERLHELRAHLGEAKVPAEDIVVEGVAFDQIISKPRCTT